MPAGPRAGQDLRGSEALYFCLVRPGSGRQNCWNAGCEQSDASAACFAVAPGDLYGSDMNDSGLSRCSQLESCALWRILDATRHLAAPVGVEEVLQKTIASSLQVLDADRASVFLYDPKADELYIKVSTSFPEVVSRQQGSAQDAEDRSDTSCLIRFSSGKGIAGETAQKRSLINVPDCYTDPRFNRDIHFD